MILWGLKEFMPVSIIYNFILLKKQKEFDHKIQIPIITFWITALDY